MIESTWNNYAIPANIPAAVIHDPALPLVSIVTPSYNQGHFIRETIESVLTQDYPNIEYWVIDGGSTDNTLDVLRDYDRDPRFHWISEPDKGQSDAINKGWSRSQGDIVAWLCSDDLYCAGAIRRQVSYLLSHPDVDVVYSDALFIDAEGRFVSKLWGRHFSQYELLRISFVPQPTAFMRRKIMETTGCLDTTLHYYMDPDYWLRASIHGHFAYVPAEIAKYRLHDASKSVSKIASFNPEIERVVERFLQQQDFPTSLMPKQAEIYADMTLMIAINYANAGSLSEAGRYLSKSLHHKLFRPRLFWLLLAIVEAKTRLPLTKTLSEKWLALRSRV